MGWVVQIAKNDSSIQTQELVVQIMVRWLSELARGLPVVRNSDESDQGQK